MSKTGKGLAAYCKAQLGRPYWWGTFGQRATDGLYRQKKAQYPGYYTAGDFAAQYGQRVHDCVGLIKGYRWSDTPESTPRYVAGQDVAVSGLYSQCSRHGEINTMPDIPGVCVFMAGLGHVGVYIGNGRVVEARGHAYGVVETNLTGRGWAFWGIPDWLDCADGGETHPSDVSTSDTGALTCGSADTFTPPPMRYLRYGDTGADVRALQRQLIRAGHDVGQAGADGEFGSDTLKALKAAQAHAGIETDGEFGPDTFAALWDGR